MSGEAPTTGAGEWRAWAQLQWAFFQVCLAERFVYRGDFFLGTFFRFLPIVTQIFLWGAVFAAVAQPSEGDARVAGFSYHEIIAYYLITMLARAASSMPGLASGIARDVREGTIKKYLIQPVDMLNMLLLQRLAHKLVYYVMAAVPFAIVFYLCRGFFDATPDGVTLLAFVVSLLLAFVLGFLLEAVMGLLAFWLLEVSSLLLIFMMLNFFFSGHMFPIDILPSPWQEIVRWLPFMYLAYFPAAVFLGKVAGWDLLWGLAGQVGWVLVFFLLARVVFARGVKRYSGFGG